MDKPGYLGDGKEHLLLLVQNIIHHHGTIVIISIGISLCLSNSWWSTLVDRYVRCLEDHPLLTNSTTSGLLGVVGDAIAQLVATPENQEFDFGGAQNCCSCNQPQMDTLTSSSNTPSGSVGSLDGSTDAAFLVSSFNEELGDLVTSSDDESVDKMAAKVVLDAEKRVFYAVGETVETSCVCGSEQKKHFATSKVRAVDFRRSGSVFCESLFVSGPLMYVAYDFMEKVVPIQAVDAMNRTERSCVYAAILQVVIDCIIMDPVYVFTAMVGSGIFEGSKVSDLRLQLRRDFSDSVKASWMSSLLFMPMQLMAFSRLPLKWRTLAMNVQDIVWSAVISYMAHRSRKNGMIQTRDDTV